ncbi:hypothetical protein [Elizabethkingia meningoseptica]|uniref:hypothetical protein n=1 Tax=Elizabethkingia meningoseptica TaxID=238 RepID=UPI0038929C1F
MMKKLFLAASIFLSASVSVSAQLALTSIQNNQTELVVNDSIYLKKGSPIQIYLPAGKDFVFVKQKKSGLNAKLLGKMADIAGTGAAAVGMGSGNLKTLSNAYKVVRTANAVQYGANALDKIQDLPISNEAKKIAGTKMEILDWEFTDDGYIITAKSDKKKYEIYLQEAAIAGEVKL